MDRDTVKIIRKDMEEALTTVATKHKLAFEIGRITFSDKGFGVRIEASESLSEGVGEKKIAIDFKNGCGKYGFVPEDLGKRFTGSNGDVYTIIGLKPRNRKYPIIGTNDIGKEFKFSSFHVKSRMV